MLLTLLQFFATKFLVLALHLESGSFPKPLSAREEQAAFAALRAGDTAAREKLIRHNLRLVAHIVKKYYALPGDQDDLVSIGTIGLVKAVDITSFLRVTGCPLFAAVSAQNIQSQTDQQSHINAEHFSLAGIAHKAFDAGFIDREDLLQKNHGRFFKGRVGIHQHMGGLVFLLFRPGSNSCNDQCRRMTVSNVVLQNYHRAFPALFRADMRLHVCIVDVPSEISPIVR